MQIEDTTHSIYLTSLWFVKSISYIMMIYVVDKVCSNLLNLQAIEKYLPKVKRIRCWNHTINAVKTWLRKHGATSTEIPVYNVRELLNQASYEEYCKKLKKAEINWSQAFHQYYMNVLHSEVRC